MIVKRKGNFGKFDILRESQIDAMVNIFADQLKHQKIQLLSRLFCVSPIKAVLHDFTLTQKQEKLYQKKCFELEQGMPLDYVVGEMKTQNGYVFTLSPDVLIPRPETENLIELVKNTIKRNSLIVDVGTGSGFIAIQLAKFAERIYATDISSQALNVCKKNIERNNIANITIFQADLLQNLDLISNIKNKKEWVLVANLPYVPMEDKADVTKNRIQFEPEIAIFAAENGLEVFNKLIEQLKKLPLPIHCYFELDPRNIIEASKKLKELGYEVRIGKDALEFSRYLVGELKGV